MRKTFEERIGTELDSLYQGALFLTAGSPSRAERLVLEAALNARQSAPDPSTTRSFTASVERCLVRVFLEEGAPPKAFARAPVAAAHDALALLGTVTSDDLHRAAATVPARSRAALWLVLLRRWTYADAAEALGVDRSMLREYLEDADMLHDALARRPGPGGDAMRAGG